MKVAVSGAMGRLGSAIMHSILKADDMKFTGAYAPSHLAERIGGLIVEDNIENIDAQIIVECTHPDVVMKNLKAWHAKGISIVIGTSGFTKNRIQELKSFWGENDTGCLIVPNFSIGAMLMMRFAEIASKHFDSAEIIERHENTKPDAPSGTALATAMRIGKFRDQTPQTTDIEIVKGARGGDVSGVRIHSLRMSGVLSNQEVAFSNTGETFSINHTSTSYKSFVNGALATIRHVPKMRGVVIGLDAILDFQ